MHHGGMNGNNFTRNNSMKYEFGSFVRNGKRYNCVYDPTQFKKGKGYLVRYDSKNPLATNFYKAPDSCRAKLIESLIK